MSLTLYLITRLLAIADRDVEQSQTAGLGPEWRFDMAHNAVLQLATAALAAAGYQAERQTKHKRTLECLELAAGIDPDTVSFPSPRPYPKHPRSSDSASPTIATATRIPSQVSRQEGSPFP